MKPATTTPMRDPQEDGGTVETLRGQFGDVIGAAELRRLFHWSASAFRDAADRGALPFRTFSIPGRRGRFARVEDVAEALSGRRR